MISLTRYPAWHRTYIVWVDGCEVGRIIRWRSALRDGRYVWTARPAWQRVGGVQWGLKEDAIEYLTRCYFPSNLQESAVPTQLEDSK